MPKRAELTYPRLTIRRYGSWGVWKAAVVVKILDHPGARERTLAIAPRIPQAMDAATLLIDRFRLAEELGKS